ncbi:mannitol dehydrogenase family protein, partial [Streptomyces sp. G35A]
MRLSQATIGRLPEEVERPRYDRSSVRAGVVHLGIGAFHRAHQAVVFDDLVRGGDARWGIRAASLRSPATRDALAPQDGLYSVVVRDGAEERERVIGSVLDVLVAPEDPAALVEALAAPETHIVTLTVT